MKINKVPLTEEEIEKIAARYLTGLGVAGLASLILLNVFPGILVSIGVTAGFCGVAGLTSKQIDKLSKRKKDE